MIQAIVGGTGDGKSLLATRYITESLLQTDAVVVTNIPLVMGELHQYISKRLSEGETFDMDDRVKVLKDEEVMEFYRYRSGGLVLPPSPDMEDGDDGTKRIPKPEFMARMKEGFALMLEKKEFQRPVHYFIDEAHNFFGSRDWKSNGRALLYYVSQHRHLHDEVYLITQVIDDVEKQFRDRVLMTHRSQNQLRMRIGMVRAKACFRVSVYNRLPSGNKDPMYSVEYDAKHLDADAVAKCYKTVGALGIHSSPEAKPNRAIFPYWALWVGGGLAVALVAAGIFGLPYLGSYFGKSIVKGTMLGIEGGVPKPPTTKPTDASSTQHVQAPVGQSVASPTDNAPASIRVRSWAMTNREGMPWLLVTLSDGTTIPPTEIESYNLRAGERWVRWNGRTYR